jgi:hypothetical protein
MTTGLAWGKILILATSLIIAVTVICLAMGWFRNKGD